MTDSSQERLDGLTILITREAEQAKSFSGRLQALGAQTLEFPAIEFADPDFEEFDRLTINRSYDWVIFASANAFERTWRRLKQTGSENLLRQASIAAIGAATKSLIEASGLKVSFCPSQFVAESLVQEFPQALPAGVSLQELSIFWPRTDIGRDVISRELLAQGAKLSSTVIYKTQAPVYDQQSIDTMAAKLKTGQIDVVTIASSQSARNLAQIFKDHDKTELWNKTRIAAIGPITAKTCRDCLGKADLVSQEFSLDGLIKTLLASLKYPNNLT
ncbi:MAG: uroporphyrinogen-III synthase [Candidatus Obscuribacterales bacterium]|nr:uroporphyrinogen-III synthase [Candidatus Obscuribacterales bacterium]